MSGIDILLLAIIFVLAVCVGALIAICQDKNRQIASLSERWVWHQFDSHSIEQFKKGR